MHNMIRRTTYHACVSNVIFGGSGTTVNTKHGPFGDVLHHDEGDWCVRLLHYAKGVGISAPTLSACSPLLHKNSIRSGRVLSTGKKNGHCIVYSVGRIRCNETAAKPTQKIQRFKYAVCPGVSRPSLLLTGPVSHCSASHVSIMFSQRATVSNAEAARVQ